MSVVDISGYPVIDENFPQFAQNAKALIGINPKRINNRRYPKINYVLEAYNAAQTFEIKLFDELLKDLVNSVEQPEQIMGRPRLELKESLFCAIQKVYSQLSQRRAHTLYRNAEGKAHI